jgi:hypothetical protein
MDDMDKVDRVDEKRVIFRVSGFAAIRSIPF